MRRMEGIFVPYVELGFQFKDWACSLVVVNFGSTSSLHPSDIIKLNLKSKE